MTRYYSYYEPHAPGPVAAVASTRSNDLKVCFHGRRWRWRRRGVEEEEEAPSSPSLHFFTLFAVLVTLHARREQPRQGRAKQWWAVMRARHVDPLNRLMIWAGGTQQFCPKRSDKTPPGYRVRDAVAWREGTAGAGAGVQDDGAGLTSTLPSRQYSLEPAEVM